MGDINKESNKPESGDRRTLQQILSSIKNTELMLNEVKRNSATGNK